MDRFKGKTSRAPIIALLICLALLLTAACVCISPDIAYANGGEADTFELFFPSAGYLQTERPTLIAANGERIAVYDEAAETLYSINADGSLLKFDFTSLPKDPDNLFLLKGAAFIVCGEETFIFDFAYPAKAPLQVTLSSPENASYYTGDGEFIYAKSAFGKISAFEFSSDALAPVYENVNSEALTGKFAVAGYGDTVCAFSSEYNLFSKFVKINLSDGSETENPASENKFLRASASSSALFASDGTSLYALSKENGGILFDCGMNPRSFAAYGDKLFLISPENRIEIYSVSAAGLTLLSSVGMTGSDLGHLDSPSDLAIAGDSVIAADTNNNRLLEFNDRGEARETLLPYSPSAVAIGGGNIFAAGGHNISVVSPDGSARHFNFTQTIIDVTYTDKLYALADDGICTLFAGTLIKLGGETGKRLTSAEDGKYLYLLSDTELKMLDASGNTAVTLLIDDAPADIAADYAGNVFLLYENRIVKYENTLSALIKTAVYPIFSDNTAATPNSLAFYGHDKMLFSANESFIGAIAADSVSKDIYSAPEQPPITADAQQRFYRLKSGKTAYLLGLSGRAEDFEILSENITLLAFPSVTSTAGTCVALRNGEKFEISTADFDMIEPSPLNAEYIANENCELYFYPGSEPSGIALSAGEHVVAADNAAGIDKGKWLRISINGSLYYAPVTILSPVIEEKPEISKVYGKIKADRVGGTVRIYSAADENAETVCEIVDGKKVEILQTLENFYFIRFGDTTGYVLKANVVLNGLTTVQIIAIAVSAAVLLAGGVVFAAVYQAKKKSEKKS